MKSNRILWIDSIKGIMCWWVFLSHFNVCFGFVPVLYRLIERINYFVLLVSGNPGMNSFIMMAAFIEAKSFLNKTDDFSASAGRGIFKRYLRLSFPVFLIELLVFICQKTGLWTDRFYPTVVRDISFSEILGDSFYKCMFFGSSEVYPVFWMMNLLFVGYILVLLACLLISAMKKEIGYIFIILLSMILFANLSNYFSCALGVFLYMLYRDIYKEGDKSMPEKRKAGIYIIGAAFIIFSTYLCVKCMGLSDLMTVKGAPACFTQFYCWCWLSGALLMVGIIICLPLIKLLDNKYLAMSGKICLPVFLFHPLCMVTFGDYVFRFFDARAGKYNHGVKAAFIVCILSTIALSLAYVKYVEPLMNKLIDRINSFTCSKSSKS